MKRREFIKTTAAASLAAAMPRLAGAYAQGADPIRVGVVGCGGRGTGAAIDCLNAAPGVEVVAMYDLFMDRVESSLGSIKEKHPDKVKVTPERMFTGFDGFKKLSALPEVNLIIMASPPGFRPMQLKAAVEGGKNVFMEKPVAVDPVGIRSVIASSELAGQKKLAIVAGTQRRHQARYFELLKRLHEGAIGETVGGRGCGTQGALW